MTPDQIDTIAQELHALFCGPGRWEHAMPASQDLYRSAVRVVLESSHLTNLELMRQKTELMKLYLAGKTHIAALENVAEAARLLYGVAQTDDIGRQYVAVSWSTWEALRAALDAAQPKDPVVETWLDIDSVTDSGQPGSSQEGGTQRDQCNDVTVSGESVPAGPLESCSVENQRAPIVAMPQPDQPGCSSPIDDPSLDGTDGAHPAWWRGHDSASEAWDKRLGQALAETAQLRADVTDRDITIGQLCDAVTRLRADVTTLARTLTDYGVCADDGDLHEIIQRGQASAQADTAACYCSDRMSAGLPCLPGKCPNVLKEPTT